MTAYERKKSLMSTAEIQREIDLIRLAYRERGEPLNRRKIDLARWIAYGLAIGIILAVASYF